MMSLCCCDCDSGGTVDGTLLASLYYRPIPPINPIAFTEVFTDVDPGLTITFTAPASGHIQIRQEALGQIVSDNIPVAAADGFEWNLRESGVDVSGTNGAVILTNQPALISSEYQIRLGLTTEVTGLVPGSVHTYTWGFRITSTGSLGFMFIGDAFPVSLDPPKTFPAPASITIFSVP